MRDGPPVELEEYLGELVERLRALLAGELVGVYAGGSVALGDYEHGRSDVDIAAVVQRLLGGARKEAIVAALRHDVLPCPARGLELVVYTEEEAGASSARAAFQLNLNTGEHVPFRVDFAPGDEAHWFALDRSVLACHGLALSGPPAETLFTSPRSEDVLALLASALQWWQDEAPAGPDAVLNASRSLYFARTGRWVSKRRAAEWVLERALDRDLVAAALAARANGAHLDAERARAFLAAVAREVRGA